jgi:hypothetical protein
MNKKHHEKVFEVNGVKLRLRKLGLAEFPSFKTIYATAIENKDIEGTIKAHQTLFSWLEYEVLPDEWVPVYNKAQDEFIIDKLNDVIVADTIINTLLIEVLTPLFLNTAELTK